MVSDVDHELRVQKWLENVLGLHVSDGLLRTGRHARRYYNNSTCDLLLFHLLNVGHDRLDAHFGIVGKEDIELVCRVVDVRDEDDELGPGGLSLARTVPVGLLELVQRLLELIGGHHVAAVVAQLQDSLADAPQFVYFCLVVGHSAK